MSGVCLTFDGTFPSDISTISKVSMSRLVSFVLEDSAFSPGVTIASSDLYRLLITGAGFFLVLYSPCAYNLCGSLFRFRPIRAFSMCASSKALKGRDIQICVFRRPRCFCQLTFMNGSSRCLRIIFAMPTSAIRCHCATVNFFNSTINGLFVFFKRGGRLSKLPNAISCMVRCGSSGGRDCGAGCRASPIVRCRVAKASSSRITDRGRTSRHSVLMFVSSNYGSIHASHTTITIRRSARSNATRYHACRTDRRILSFTRRLKESTIQAIRRRLRGPWRRDRSRSNGHDLSARLQSRCLSNGDRRCNVSSRM